jgi:hypothetical protein
VKVLKIEERLNGIISDIEVKEGKRRERQNEARDLDAFFPRGDLLVSLQFI